jgi:hypothetical protein
MRKRSKTVSSKELVVTALHVLVAWNDGRKPAPAEIQLLKEALPSAAHLPVDELCYRVIHDLSGRTFQESEHYPAHQQIVDEVA